MLCPHVLCVLSCGVPSVALRYIYNQCMLVEIDDILRMYRIVVQLWWQGEILENLAN